MRGERRMNVNLFPDQSQLLPVRCDNLAKCMQKTHEVKTYWPCMHAPCVRVRLRHASCRAPCGSLELSVWLLAPPQCMGSPVLPHSLLSTIVCSHLLDRTLLCVRRSCCCPLPHHFPRKINQGVPSFSERSDHPEFPISYCEDFVARQAETRCKKCVDLEKWKQPGQQPGVLITQGSVHRKVVLKKRNPDLRSGSSDLTDLAL